MLASLMEKSQGVAVHTQAAQGAASMIIPKSKGKAHVHTDLQVQAFISSCQHNAPWRKGTVKKGDKWKDCAAAVNKSDLFDNAIVMRNSLWCTGQTLTARAL